jgi:hypothetical protein
LGNNRLQHGTVPDKQQPEPVLPWSNNHNVLL